MRGNLKWIGGAFFAIVLALIPVVFTVPFKDARKAGASYLTAFTAGGQSILITLLHLFLSISFLWPMSLIVAVIMTLIIHRTIMNLQRMPTVSATDYYGLGSEMETYGSLIQNRFQWPGDPARIAADLNAFLITVQKSGFALPIRPEMDDSAKLDALGPWFSAVGALLQRGHVAEAKAYRER